MSNVSSCARVPKYRHHKATGQAVVTIAGKDHYLGKYNSAASKEAYRRLAAEYLAHGGMETLGDLTVVELCAAYKAFAKSYYQKNGKPTSELKMMCQVIELVVPLYGRTLANEFGPKRLKSFRQQMIEKDWCRSHVNKQVDRIRRIFKWGVSEELVPALTYHALRTVTGLRKGRSAARESQPVQPVPDGVLDATLAKLSPVVREMVLLQRWTGARPGEICDLRRCELIRAGTSDLVAADVVLACVFARPPRAGP